ncbi:MAG: hypothetical protein QOJ35_536 [Solirubrobacteraceae bacterium]|jgi:hypothetical protein|nr:hypothetical protein [Solirubrobacteraceae bacterium]
MDTPAPDTPDPDPPTPDAPAADPPTPDPPAADPPTPDAPTPAAQRAHRTLIVANLTASTPSLLQEVERRAQEQPTTFDLLVPNVDPKRAADWSLAKAVQLLERVAGGHVEGRLGGQDAFESVQEAVAGGTYDDVIISTLPKGRSEWLKKDLPSRVETLDIPVTVITLPEEQMSALKAFTEQILSRPAEGSSA